MTRPYRRPRSDSVLRRFMAGESVEDIVEDEWLHRDPRDGVGHTDIREDVESALRRAFLRAEKRRRRS